MNVFQIEELRQDLISELNSEKSPFFRLKLFNIFFREVSEVNNQIFEETFLAEFIPDYLESVKNLSAIGISPLEIEEEIESIEKFANLKIFKSNTSDLLKNLDRIRNEFTDINKSLSDSEFEFDKNILSFPVNLISNSTSSIYGQIETFTVKIHSDSSLKENKFLIIPLAGKIDERLENQLTNSWQIALNYLKQFYKKPNKFHEVVLAFNHKVGNIEGYSLGISITLGFLQELFKFYNTNLSLTLTGNATFTGGLESNKKVISIGKKIIEQKVDTVFFSKFNFFAIPDEDIFFAKSRFSELKEKYPNRNLKILSIEDFGDLLNHRQIISIGKAKVITRTNKFLKNNTAALVLSLILLVILGSYLIYKIDNNPYSFSIINDSVKIINKSGKILWTTQQPFSDGTFKIGYDQKFCQRIYDIDGDGTNEVILSNESGVFEKLLVNKNCRINCYNNYGELIWTYVFEDSISTKEENYDPKAYNNFILGIVKEKNKTVLLAVSRHLYFPSAIYKLDIKTGKRIDGTLWSQGHFNHKGVVGDFNNDGKTQIFIGGISNSKESAFILLFDYDSLYGKFQIPNDKKLFNSIPIAKVNQYFLVGKTDVCNYLNLRFNSIASLAYDRIMDDFYCNTFEGSLKQPIGLVYRFSKDFSFVKTQIGDDLQYIRDSLVIKGFLKPPFTTDPEYSKILINGIKKWDGEKFVKFQNQ